MTIGKTHSSLFRSILNGGTCVLIFERAKSEILSELIDNEHVSVTSSEIGEYLNRPSIYCRDLTESPDWFILFDVVTDQLLVLDLSTGWLDVKRLSFYIHQNSLHHGKYQ